MKIDLLGLLGRLSLFSAMIFLTAAQSSRSSTIHPLEAPITPTIPNLLDVLTASPNHTILVRLLQRTRLIPTLMNLMEFGDGRGLTIMAPTDEGIRKKKESEEDVRKIHQNSADTKHFTAEYEEEKLQAQSLWEWAWYLATQEDTFHEEEDLIAPVWTSDEIKLGNINAVLRQQLLYHMVNYTLPYNFTLDGDLQDSPSSDSMPTPGSAVMLATLHRPSHRLLHEPTRPGPVPQPPSSPPHPGAEDEGGLLAGEGQKVRIAATEKGHVFLGTNSKGAGGIPVVKADRSSRKGLILSVDGVIDLPPSLATLLATDPTLQYLQNLTTSTLLRSLTETAHTTFFLPTEASFDPLSAVEKSFITGDWELAKQDRLKLLGEHMSGIGLGQGKIAYASRLKENESTDMTTIFGGGIQVKSGEDGTLLVDGAKVVTEDILIENGVVHIIDKLLLPYGDLNLSVEKTLLASNASHFVSLMHTAGLQDYINVSPHDNDDDKNQAEPWTFVVPRDDTIEEWWRDRQQGDNHPWSTLQQTKDTVNATKLIDLLKYHIAPLQLTPDNLTDGMLIGTELRDWRLKDARQKLTVEVQEKGANGRGNFGNGDVAFGDANVIADPVKVGPSIIYLISKMLETPSDPLQTAVSSLSLSTFVAAVFSAQMDKDIKKAPAITYLVPRNEAFGALGLAMQYLLLDQTHSRSELRSLLEYHAIDEIVYMKDFVSGFQRYPTLESSSIWAGRNENGSVEVKRGTEGRNARILEADLLTSTGVLHEIDQVDLPPTLDLTIGKLMKGAKADTMTSLVQSAGYGWILNASKPTWEQQAEFEEDRVDMRTLSKFPHKRKHNKDKKTHRKGHELFQDWNQSYVILCPTDNAFTRVNLTYYFSNPDALKALVQLHIIPAPANQILPSGNVNQLPLAIRDTSAFSTLLDSAVGGVSQFGKITFRKMPVTEEDSTFFTGITDNGRPLNWMVGIADTRGTDGSKHSANLLAFGRESLSIDRNSKADTVMQMLLRKRPKDGNNGEEGKWDSRGLGGVLTIDGVLEPYEPGWFYRWGWIALISFLVGLILASMGFGIWMWWHRDGRISLPEALEGEEE